MKNFTLKLQQQISSASCMDVSSANDNLVLLGNCDGSLQLVDLKE